MSRFLSNRFAGMAAYVPGEQPQNRVFNKLNTNESPFPPCPGVRAAIDGEQIDRLNLYSDPDTRETSGAIAAYYGLKPENVVLGNGSDELLSFCFQAFCDNENPPRYPEVSYGFYPVFARAFCLTPRVMPVDAQLQIHPEDYYHAGGMVVLANPNAPTGQALTKTDIEGVLRTNPDHVVVVDEAYVDFGGESCLPLWKAYPNLVVIRTMSKSRSLAGARLGYALGDAGVIGDLNTMKFSFNPYNVNRLSLLAGKAAMEDEAYFQSCTAAIIRTREETERALRGRGFSVLPSKANFLFAKPNFLPGGDYYRALKERGVLVRHFDTPQLTDYVRISIGAKEQMEDFLRATDDLMKGDRP